MSFALSGLVSGMDTSTIIEQLLYLERAPQRKLAQQKTAVQSKQAKFQALNSKLSTLQAAANSLKDVGATGVLQARKATVADTTKFSATVDSTAGTGDYGVTVNAIALAQKNGGEAYVGGQAGGLTLTKVGDPASAKTINFSGLGTVTDVANAINTASAGMQATVVAGRLILTGKETGETYTIADDQGGALMLSLGLSQAGTPTTPKQIQAAQDASVTVDGLPAVTSKSNTFDGTAISGVKLTVSATGTSNLKVEQDQDATVDKVQYFVNSYNAILDQIAADSKATDQPVDPNDSSKGTYKASGAFTGDSTIRQLQSQLNQMVTGLVDADGSVRIGADIGMSTDKTGKLVLDTAKFKTALSADPFAVQKLFANENTATHTDTNGTTVKEINYGVTGTPGDGIAVRVSAYVDMLTSSFSQYNNSGPGGARLEGLLKGRIDGFGTLAKRYDDNISAFDRRMELRETNLRKQFSAMEIAISNLKDQQSRFQSALAGLPGMGA